MHECIFCLLVCGQFMLHWRHASGNNCHINSQLIFQSLKWLVSEMVMGLASWQQQKHMLSVYLPQQIGRSSSALDVITLQWNVLAIVLNLTQDYNVSPGIMTWGNFFFVWESLAVLCTATELILFLCIFMSICICTCFGFWYTGSDSIEHLESMQSPGWIWT